jgi:uncharacterized protein (TIGR01777 family)
VKVIIAGSSGFLGQALARDLIAAGHRITRLVRRPATGPTEVTWRPDHAELDPAALVAADAVISLSGAGIGDRRWTAEYKQVLRDSRLQTTSTIARTLADLAESDRPPTWLSASGIGIYGERGDQPLLEVSERGEGFIADLVADWEAATAPAAAAGVRVATMRSGLVLARSGGLLKRLLPIYLLGAGGRLGSGEQYQSWITLADEISAFRHVLNTPGVSGPVNLAGPNPVRNAEFNRVLGQVTHRPAVLSVPGIALRAVLGEFADEGVLVSQRVVPEVLAKSGFRFRHPDLRSALEWAMSN